MQLDADTGEETRWVERKTDEVIDLTGEDEGEGVAVNQVDFEETPDSSRLLLGNCTSESKKALKNSFCTIINGKDCTF